MQAFQPRQFPMSMALTNYYIGNEAVNLQKYRGWTQITRSGLHSSFSGHSPYAEAGKDLELVEMVLIDAARSGAMLFADRGGHANKLTHHSASPHHAGRAKGYVSDTDVTTRHKQILNVAAV